MSEKCPRSVGVKYVSTACSVWVWFIVEVSIQACTVMIIIIPTAIYIQIVKQRNTPPKFKRMIKTISSHTEIRKKLPGCSH